MVLEKLIAGLEEIKAELDKPVGTGSYDEEDGHIRADALLVEFVAECCARPAEFKALWDSIPKWYA